MGYILGHSARATLLAAMQESFDIQNEDAHRLRRNMISSDRRRPATIPSLELSRRVRVSSALWRLPVLLVRVDVITIIVVHH